MLVTVSSSRGVTPYMPISEGYVAPVSGGLNINMIKAEVKSMYPSVMGSDIGFENNLISSRAAAEVDKEQFQVIAFENSLSASKGSCSNTKYNNGENPRDDASGRSIALVQTTSPGK